MFNTIRLVSAILVVLTVMLALPEPSIARDPPCNSLSMAIEDPPIGSVCLDDWIRFNQELWVDLFWPNAFDPNQPFIFVDERLGEWSDPISTTGRTFQGDQIWIDTGVPPELISFQELIAEGTIDASQYQMLHAADARAGDAVVVLTNQDSGLGVIMHAWLMSFRQSDETYFNLIIPYDEFDLKAGEISLRGQGPGLCVVEPCICPDGTVPGDAQNQTYELNMCAKLDANAQTIRDITRRHKGCRRRALGMGVLGSIGTCLGVVCAFPSGPAAIGVGAAGITATSAALAIALAECDANRAAAFTALATETETYRQIECLRACVATPPAPQP
jgi:hypothetical protein